MLEHRPDGALLVEDLYLNPGLGLSFRKPPGWVFEELSDLEDAARGRIYDPGNRALDAILRALWQEHLPVVGVASPPAEVDEGCVGPREGRPAIVVYVEALQEESSAERAAPRPLSSVVDEGIAYLSSVLPEYRVLKEPERTRVAGREAWDFCGSYLYHHESLETPIPTRERAVFMASGPVVYSIRMFDYPEQHASLAFDYDPFVASLWVVPDRRPADGLSA